MLQKEEMMGLGSFGNGGSSSSSSNLSALAPPFTVDRSVPKPNSNSLVHFTEPSYAVPFNSSLHSWLHSQPPTSRPDFFPNPDLEVDSTRATNSYRYSGSQSINSPTTHLPQSNPSATIATDAFSYGQFSDGTATSHVDATPYYPPYVSPAIHDDSPLVVLNEPSYDLLSASHVAPLNASSQDDCTHSLSGLEYTPQWGGFWNGLADGQQRKRMELDGSFCSKETAVAGSSIYKNYMNQGACAAEGFSTCDEVSAVSHGKYSNILGSKNHIGTLSAELLDDKSFLVQKPTFIPVESSRTSYLGSTSIFPETHPQPPSLESVTNSWNRQKPYSASYEKCFRPLDSCMIDRSSVTKSSPALVVRPPAVGTSSSAPNTVSSKNVNSVGNDAAGYSEDFAGHNPSNGKEPRLPLSSDGKEVCLDTSRVSIHTERNDDIFVKSSSTKKEELSDNKPVPNDVLDHMFKARFELQVPRINSPNGFTLAFDSAETVNSAENSSESLEYYNPAVDSPCWKGAPASRFSPFEVSEALTSQLLMKTLGNGLSLHGPQIYPHPLPTNEAVEVSSPKLSENTVYHENGCVENGLSPSPKKPSGANYPSREHRPDDAVKAGSYHPKLSRGIGFQFSNDMHEPRKESALPNNSRSDFDSKSSYTMQPSVEDGKFTSEIMLASGAAVADTGMDINDASEYGRVPFHATEYASCSPSSGEDAPAKLAKLHGGESTPKMNVQMLVNAMHNLSELLQFHCSNDACALKEQDHEALKHVINNLDACISKKVEQFTPMRESLFPQQSTSYFLGEPNLHKGACVGRPQVTKEVAASVQRQLDCQRVHEEKRHYMSGKRDENFPDFVSLRNADIVKDDKMTQAIKKVLEENFHGEEETQPQTLLYKNLWLEAEAALCSISYRARFDRMKIEMEKCKSDKAKDVSENTTAVEKLSSFKVSPDPNIVEKLALEAKDSPTPDISIHDSPVSNTASHVDDEEASVMARFHILKCRGDNSNSMNMEGQQLPEVVDLGFAGKRNSSSFIRGRSEDGNLDVTMGPDWQPHNANCTEDKFGSYLDGSEHETVKEFRVWVTDDPAIQSCRLGNQLPAGWYDGSSSDWEHVLKEEFTQR